MSAVAAHRINVKWTGGGGSSRTYSIKEKALRRREPTAPVYESTLPLDIYTSVLLYLTSLLFTAYNFQKLLIFPVIYTFDWNTLYNIYTILKALWIPFNWPKLESYESASKEKQTRAKNALEREDRTFFFGQPQRMKSTRALLSVCQNNLRRTRERVRVERRSIPQRCVCQVERVDRVGGGAFLLVWEGARVSLCVSFFSSRENVSRWEWKSLLFCIQYAGDAVRWNRGKIWGTVVFELIEISFGKIVVFKWKWRFLWLVNWN